MSKKRGDLRRMVREAKKRAKKEKKNIHPINDGSLLKKEVGELEQYGGLIFGCRMPPSKWAFARALVFGNAHSAFNLQKRIFVLGSDVMTLDGISETEKICKLIGEAQDENDHLDIVLMVVTEKMYNWILSDMANIYQLHKLDYKKQFAVFAFANQDKEFYTINAMGFDDPIFEMFLEEEEESC